MSCFVCQGPLNEFTEILLSADGDFACSQKCKDKYEKDKAHFFNVIVHDPDKCEAWLLGADI